MAAAAGTLAGLNSLLEGLYARTAWAWLGFAAMATLLVAIVATRRPPGRIATGAVVALGSLAAWQYLSREWAESSHQALVEAQRTAVYAACLGALVVVGGARRNQAAAFAGLAAGTVVCALLSWGSLVAGPVPAVFVGGRLADPLGYMNGEAAALLLGFWPCIALAERRAHPLLGAAAVWAATLLLCMALMTQSRAALAALLISVIVTVLAVPGGGRRLLTLALPIAGAATAAPRILDVYASGNERAALPEAAIVHDAMLLVMVAAVVAGLAWAGIGLALARAPRPDLGRIRAPALAVAAIAVVIGLAVGGGTAAREIDRQWAAFKSLEQPTGTSRLTTAGGNRYDYWRVAAEQLRSDPVKGVGAGNFDTSYFRERRTPEDVRQPHSLALQTLSDTGLVGFALLLVLAALVAVGFVRSRAAARDDADARALTVAAAGLLVVYGVHVNVDWLHLLPGITLGALLAAAVLLRMVERPRPRSSRGPAPLRAIAFCATALALASLATGWRAERDLDAAERLVSVDAAGAVERASDSLRLESDALQTHYVLSAAYARMDRYEDALRVLLRARALEPHDFIPLVLIGDLSTRRGDRRLAAEAYGKALELNPLAAPIEQSLAQVRNSAAP